MTITGADGPACREMRQLLGVYVVGAIDPAERSLVDEHLGTCQSCRDELAGLAGLPAMLSRVPAEDVARMAGSVVSLPEHHEPSPELLNSLLRKVATKRRTRLYRGLVSVAAAAAVAAGGTAVVLNATSAAAPAWSAASGVNPATQVSAVVKYTSEGSGTQMKVRVSGITPGTRCQFWVIGANGKPVAAGSWTVELASYLPSPWYRSASPVALSSVHAFEITSAGKQLIEIPAG
jgi:anti-sigma-K factor RskA